MLKIIWLIQLRLEGLVIALTSIWMGVVEKFEWSQYMISSSQITKTVELLGITALQFRVEEQSLSLLFFDQNHKKAINRCFQKLFFSESYILEENVKQICFAFPKNNKKSIKWIFQKECFIYSRVWLWQM